MGGQLRPAFDSQSHHGLTWVAWESVSAVGAVFSFSFSFSFSAKSATRTQACLMEMSMALNFFCISNSSWSQSTDSKSSEGASRKSFLKSIGTVLSCVWNCASHALCGNLWWYVRQ